MTAREAVICVDAASAHIVADVGPGDDLNAAGIDSAVLIEVGLLLESELGVRLSAAEVDGLTTLAGIDAVLDRHRARR